MSDLISEEPPPPPQRPRARTSVPSPPVVRFKDVEVMDQPTSPAATEDEPSFYDSDASQASVSSPRRRRRRAALRQNTTYLLARPAPKLATNKTLFKTIRPRLLLQLQELAAAQRPRPTIDVFPASLVAGPLATARYIHRFPRLFGGRGELGPRDLILVKSDDYTANAAGKEEESSSGRRQPVAVLSPGRVPGDAAGEIVLDDGSIWTCSSQKGYYSFVHVDDSGASITARWVKRNPSKRVTSNPGSRSVSPVITPGPFSGSNDLPEVDYRYTFSIINPLSRRHPILATLSPQSLEIYEDYTTPSSSSGRYPPTRPVSGVMDAVSVADPPLSPLSMDEPAVERQTSPVDEDTKKLIRVTGLWLALHLGPAPSGTETGDSAPTAQPEPATVSQSSILSGTLPRRQTFSTPTNPTPPPQQRCIRRAMSTGAALLQRRRQKEPPEVPSGITMRMGKMSGMESKNHEEEEEEEEAAGPVATAAAASTTPPPTSPVQKQARRVSWFKRLTH